VLRVKRVVTAFAATAALAGTALVGVAPASAAPATAAPAAAPASMSKPPPAISASDKLVTGGVAAPKGKVGKKTGVATKPPVTASASAKAALTGTTYYQYGIGKQTATTDGVAANFKIAKPTVKSTDYHSLAEIAIESADEQQIVEIGWTVDPTTFSGSSAPSAPHLFAYHWVNGQETCYNGCGYVAYSGATVAVGADLTSVIGQELTFAIQNTGTAWWLGYNGQWIGYFPLTIWSGATPPATFAHGGLNQLFGEVALSTPTSCTDMGNGLPSSDSGSARVASTTYVNGPTVSLTVGSTHANYPTTVITARTFRYGGTGTGAC